MGGLRRDAALGRRPLVLAGPEPEPLFCPRGQLLWYHCALPLPLLCMMSLHHWPEGHVGRPRINSHHVWLWLCLFISNAASLPSNAISAPLRYVQVR